MCKTVLFVLTCSVGVRVETALLVISLGGIQYGHEVVRRITCRTRRPTASELVSAGHRLMAVLRRVETPRPLEKKNNKNISTNSNTRIIISIRKHK